MDQTAAPLIAGARSPMEAVLDRPGYERVYMKVGRRLEFTDLHPLLGLTLSGHDYFPADLTDDAAARWRTDLWDLTRKNAQDPIATYAAMNDGRSAVYDFWRYQVSVDNRARENAHRDLNRAKTLTGLHPLIEMVLTSSPKVIAPWAGLLGAPRFSQFNGDVNLRLGADSINGLLGRKNALPRKPTIFDILVAPPGTVQNLADSDWLLPYLPLIPNPLPGDLVADGRHGVTPRPAPDLSALYERLSKFMGIHGNDRGLALFPANSAPTKVAVLIGDLFELYLPPGARDHVSLANPGIVHPGAEIKKVDLRLSDGASEGGAAVVSGRAHVDIDAGGAFTKRHAEIDLGPSKRRDDQGPDAQPREEGEPDSRGRVRHMHSPLGKLLGRLDLDADLIDGGVKITGKVKPGRSGIDGIEVDGAEFEATYQNGALTLAAQVALHDRARSLETTVDLSWDGADFTARGDATIRVDQFPPIVAHFDHAGGETTIHVDNEPTFHKDFGGAVTLDGKARNLAYETGRRGGLAGDVEVHADLGILGQADAAATLQDSEIDRLAFDLQSREVSFVAGGRPIITGAASGSIEVNDNVPEGRVRGAAKLHIPMIDNAPDLDLDLRLGRDGYRGGIRAHQVDLGSFLRLEHVDVDFGDGKPSGSAKIAVRGIPFMDRCDIGVRVSEHGVDLTEAKVELSGLLDEVTRDRLDAQVGLAGERITGALTLKAGPSGIPGFDLGDTTIQFNTAGGKLVSAEGDFQLAYNAGTGPAISGSGRIRWNDGWHVEGSATIADITEGLSPFDVSIKHLGDTTEIKVADAAPVTYARTFGAVTLEGSASGIEYNARKRSFSGQANLSADFGMFGTAIASARIADNDLEDAELTYDTPELRYPADESKTALISGTAQGNIRYRNGKFSGGIRSRANLTPPQGLRFGMDSNAELGVDVQARIHEDGTYSGSVRSLRPIDIGKHFRVPHFQGDIDKDGNIHSDFSIAIVNFKRLDRGEVRCVIDENGFRVAGVDAGLTFGSPDDRMWGTVSGSYSDAGGLVLSTDANLRIRDDLIGNGRLDYSTKTNVISGELTTTPIELLTLDGGRTFFEFSRKIPVINIAGLGAYIDIGLDIGFNYHAALNMRPAIEVQNLDFDNFSYDKAIARLNIGGELSASLSTTPSIGVGVYALAPAILSGGGGIAFEIVGKASANPNAELAAEFDQEGNLQAGGRLAFPLSFGVNATLIGFANFEVLKGYLAEGEIRGALAGPIEIIPQTEIFRFDVDFGKRIGPPDDPESAIPEEAAPAKDAAGAEIVPQQDETAETEVPAAPPKIEKGEGDTDTSNDQGLGIDSMLSGLMSNPVVAKLSAVIDAAKKLWDKIGNAIDNIGKFFVDIVEMFGEAIENVLNGIAEHDLFGYVKILLKDVLGETAFYILEPILDALCESENEMVAIITNLRVPNGPGDFLDWTMEFLGSFLDFGFDSIGNLIHAVRVMADRIAGEVGTFLNQMVQEGRIGVNQYPYYFLWDDFLAPTEYKIHIGPVNIYNIDRGNITDPEDLVAFGLWEALEGFDDVIPTNTAVDEDSGDHFNDYWVGAPQKWQNK
ncbi:MAG TPA: hypothetical protein VFG83_00360 [Kofleriaceae bacterium]|nr:hypothetical protein [Kofleriaceae bacterium]